MAAPTYGNDLTTITTAENDTDFSAIGGGGAGLSASPDLAVEGTNCVDKQVTNSDKGILFDSGATITLGANDHIFGWVIGSTPGLEDTLANRGKCIIAGSSTAAYVKFHVSGVDVSVPGFRTEQCYVFRYVNTTSASPPYRTLTGSPGASPRVVGGSLSTTASVKGANLGVDVFRWGTGYYVVDGDAGTPATFAGIAADNDGSTARRGVFSAVPGGFAQQGRVVIGQDTSGTPTTAYMVVVRGAVSFTNTPHTLSDFTQFIVDGASTTCTLTDVSFKGLGTNNPGQINVINGSSLVWTRVAFSDIGVSSFPLASQLEACSWTNCGQITLAGSDFDNSTVSGYEGTANTSALIWNVATSTSGKFDGASFTMGTALTHGIEFGLSSPTTIDLTDVTFTGYSASNNVNNSMLHIRRTAGTVTINVSGGTSPSYRTDGATVVINNAVNVTFNDIVSGSRLYVEATATVGAVTSGDELVNAASTDPYTYVHNFEGNLTFLWRVRKSTSAPYYKTASGTGTITANGADINVTQILDS